MSATETGWRLGVVCVGLALLPGCALLVKNDPFVPRYFSPESHGAPTAEGSARPAVAPGTMLRLGAVGGGSYLKERIVYRDTEHELGFYDDRRWTERPELYLRRALERALFEQRGVQRALAPIAPTLTADLIEFEEVRGPHPVARIRVNFALHDDRVVLRERTLTVERPVVPLRDPSGVTGGLAVALGAALEAVVDEISDQVTRDLSAAPPTAVAGP